MDVDIEKDDQMQKYLDQALPMIHTYKKGNEGDFCEWLNRFEYIGETIGVTDDKMVEFFNKMVDDSIHIIVQEKFKYVNFLQLSYEERINYYLNTFSSSKEDNSFRKRFKYRKQYEEESIEIYANNLKKIYNKCNYTDNCEEILWEQFINGIRNDQIREDLRKLPKLSFDQMVARTVEIEHDYQLKKYVDQALPMIHTYKKGNESDFCEWLNRFEYIAETIGVTDDKIVEFFNKMVDDSIHIIVQENYKNVSFLQLSYEERINYYLNTFSSSKEDNSFRKRFKYRKQYEEESIEIYANNLKKLYNKCNYSINCEEILCEQFINGIRIDQIRDHSRKLPKLSFDQMVARTVEIEHEYQLKKYVDQALSMIHTYKKGNKVDFCEWLNKFEYIAETIGVTDDKMVEFFNRMVDDSIHTTFEEKSKNDNSRPLSYEEIINRYANVFSSIKCKSSYRKRFRCRIQFEQETIDTYANNLLKIFYKCKFKEGNEKLLVKQFQNGVHNKDLKKYLSKFSISVFKDIVKKAVEYEKGYLIPHYLSRAYSMISIYNPEKNVDFCEWLNRFEYIANTIGVPLYEMDTVLNKLLENSFNTFLQETNKDFNFLQLSCEERLNYFLNTFSLSKEDNLFRRRFKYRKQYEEESIEIYADNLQKIYNKCNYTGNCEEILREQFINGILNDTIKQLLINLSKISFKQLVAKAVSFEKDKQIQKYLDQVLSMIPIYKKGNEEDFGEWLNKFKDIANKIKVPDNKMNELFQYMVDDGIHKIVQEREKSIKLLKLSYKRKITYYIKFFSPARCRNSYIKRFKCERQRERETIGIYADNLQKTFIKCNYRRNANKILCSQFVNGLRDEELKKYLSEIPNLEFEKMVKKAVEFEKGYLIPYYLHRAYSMLIIYHRDYKDDFCEWLNRFEYVANIIGVPENNMNEFFNKMVDHGIHTIVQANYQNVNFIQLSYGEKINYYLNILSSSKEDNSFRKRFKCRKQFEQETIEIYADNLQKIFDKCQYKHNTDEILCTQFLNGIYNEELKKYLSEIPNLVFQEMVKIAIDFEKDKLIQKYFDQILSMIHIYNHEKEGDFCEWLNKFEYLANNIGVTDHEMDALFNKIVDNDINTIVKENYNDVNFIQLSYEEKINYFLNTFSSSKEDNSFRKRFKCRKQFEKETIEIYAVNLQKIFDKCNYTDNCEEILCEQFINGILNDNIREHLRKLPKLSFNQVVAKAVKIEKDNQMEELFDAALSTIDTDNKENEDDWSV